MVKRFHFSSALARMSVVASVDHEKNNNGIAPMLVLTKVSIPTAQCTNDLQGAPETIAKHLASLPPWYNDTYLYYAQQGKRVIATAYKPLSGKPSELASISREAVESDLIFSGFIIFECPVKEQSAEAISVLSSSSHNVSS